MKNVEDMYPLTPLQRGILFHTLHEPEANVYTEQLTLTLQGILQVPTFQRAWNTIVDRHTILRSSFIWEGVDEPLQIVRKQVQLAWVIEDWQHLSPTEQKQRLSDFQAADRAKGIDLTRTPLLRLALFQIAPETHWLVWTHHHILLDGWSLPIILHEVLSVYEALAANRAPTLAPVRPYRDYIAWLKRQDPNQAKLFWERLIGDFNAPTPLGIDRPLRPDAGPLRSNIETRGLSAEQTQIISEFARQHGLTLNTLIQGAWAILLRCYSGLDDIVFGTTVSGRPSDIAGIETMVGLFINTLPVRAHFQPHQPLVKWLHSLQDTQAEQRQFEYSSLVDIHGWSQIPRGLALFESLVVFENYPSSPQSSDTARSSRLSIIHIDGEEQTNYALTLVATASPVIAIKALYDSRRFEADVIQRLVGHLEELLVQMATFPMRPLGYFTPLTLVEREQILNTWNATDSAYPRTSCVHELFTAQAAATPDAIALVCEQQHLTYAYLETQSNKLANHLRRLGVGLEQCVGLCLERSPALIVAMLAILKAGGAYVPLDPTYPDERLAFMLKDAQVGVLITQTSLMERFATSPVQTICLDSNVDQQFGEDSGVPTSSPDGNNLAYVMYTSGSTGQPKGASIIHRNIVRLVRNTNYLPFSPNQVFLQFSPVAFDAATLEIWGPLLNGARLVIFPSYLPDLNELGQTIQQFGVTTLWLTAGLFSQMIEDHLPLLSGVRFMLTGGDVVSPTHARKFLQTFPGSTLINGYGPTENTTFTCCYPMTTVEQIESSLPIGRPIANTRVYILDRMLQPVPIGVTGDLYTSGDGLSRAYLNQPALTAERFIPHPFSTRAGDRLYATGDQARYRADGTIEFLGRSDQQVKLRGFRIELGEIETVLNEHPGVRNSAALVQELVAGQKRLIAFFVPNLDEGLPSPTTLRTFLQSRLPEYMIPTAFITIEQIPLTPNGKIDRQKLTATRQLPKSQTEYKAPRDNIEFQLTEIWEQVLGLRPIGVEHNFFDLGGHSLLAMRLMTRIKQIFGQRLSTASLFNQPTIAQQAQLLRESGTVPPWTPLVPLQSGGSSPPLFLIHPGGGTAFCYLPLVRQMRTDRPYYGLQAYGFELGQEALPSVAAMATAYIEAIQTVQPQGPYFLIGWSAGGTIAFEMAQQLLQQGQQIAFLGVMDTWMILPDNPEELLDAADQMIAFIGPANLPMAIEEFRNLSHEEQLQLVVELAWQQGIVSPDTGREQVLHAIGVVGNILRAVISYRPQTYPGAVTLFKTPKDPEDANRNKVQVDLSDETMGWGAISSQAVEIIMCEGDHQSMLSMPFVLSLAERLQAALDATLVDHTTLTNVTP